MPKYPAQIDNSQSLPTAIDNLTPVQGSIFNKLRDAVLAIESELGVKPAGSYTTVRARLDTLEGIVGNLQIIELHKDLGGTLEEPKVIGIQGLPVSTVPPSVGQVLAWDGVAWTPAAGGSGGPIGPPGPTGPAGLPPGNAQQIIGWDASSGIIHTVLDAGHTAGIYLITNTIIVTSPADTGTLNRTVDWTAPTYGLDNNSVGSIDATIIGTQLQNSLVIVSTGTSAVTVTYNSGTVTGAFTADLYSVATLQGVIV